MCVCSVVPSVQAGGSSALVEIVSVLCVAATLNGVTHTALFGYVGVFLSVRGCQSTGYTVAEQKVRQQHHMAYSEQFIVSGYKSDNMS